GGPSGMGGDSSGAAGDSCQMCIPAGAGCGIEAAGNGPSCTSDASGPHALLRYTAGGAGNPGYPGSAGPNPWQATLGRNWGHDFAERIVLDPSTADITHVWLITRSATFREFTNLAAASGNSLRRYQAVAPADEYRRLFFDPVSGGWQLQALDGTVELFLASGLWSKTTDPGNPRHPIAGTYAGTQLTSVALPDGRSETYAYYGSGATGGGPGKLQSITEVGTDGTTHRTWQYLWSGDDLTLIGRPDGTAWEYTYADPNHPGYVTQIRLIGTDTSGRVEAAFAYDPLGNVSQAWRGDPAATGPNAVEVKTLSYNNGGVRPTQAVVAYQVGGPTTYTLLRDSASTKSKVQQVSGECPTCGTTANVTFEYNDAANPFSPTAMIDAKGTRTHYTFDANGRLLIKTEAANVPALTRTTIWTYDSHFPGLPASVTVPSVSGGTNLRQMLRTYDPASSTLTSETITGFETTISGGPQFTKQTTYQYNSAGQPTLVDPPGYGTADQTTTTYSVPNTNGFIPDSRVDPLVGATTFGYDPFNRQTAVTDPNGLTTTAAFDALNRVTAMTRQGASSPAGDLVTLYSYTVFGNLFQTQLPNGNVLEYGYEPGGLRRLISIERKADPAPTTHGERTLYTLDAIGDRTREELQHWNGTAWIDDATTDYTYSTRCHVDKLTRGGSSVTEYSYDCNNNLQQVWDADHPSNNRTSPPSGSFGYDALDRLTSVTLGPSGASPATTAYTYDVQDHLASVTDAESNLTTYITGDRDLETGRLSPVSGTTTYQYNDHGQLVSSTDARGITVSRTVDPADRVTAVGFPEASLNVTYLYDSGPFGKGRLASITRNGQNIAYSYDRFGRTTQDGALTYGYDRNGNRTTIGYPGGVTATYGYDFADRQSTMTTSGGATSAQVTASAYKALGPLASLTLGNGLTETHAFDTRYYPTQATVTTATFQALLSWTYATDALGNITGITDTLASQNSRSFAYQDFQYFLTSGNGPWGTRSWSYDRIGGRLTETRGGTTDTYSYPQNSPAGDNPRLTGIALGANSGRRYYTYDPAGNEIQAASPTSQLDLLYDSAGRLAKLTEETTRAATYFGYDGRGFLAAARQDVNMCSAIVTKPIYGSDGVLYDRSVVSLLQPTAPPLKETRLFYFADRPVAQLDTTGSTSAVTYLSVDHLDTPVLATNASGASVWNGGFEPFGKDWNGAAGAGELLRFPGQWQDPTWAAVFDGANNLNRWYDLETGRYVVPDPIDSNGSTYAYALGNPIGNSDPLGLQALPLPSTPPSTPLPPAFPRAVPPPAPTCRPVPPPGWLPALAGAGARALGVITVVLAELLDPASAEAPTLDEPAKSCKDCKEPDSERDRRCEAELQVDFSQCVQWFGNRRDKISKGRLGSCIEKAYERYAECLHVGAPISPLSPTPFQH
nr:hypothetical protein [Acidobacteriota bacterium]